MADDGDCKEGEDEVDWWHLFDISKSLKITMIIMVMMTDDYNYYYYEKWQ